MQSLLFTPGDAFLASDSPTYPWAVVFEDEGDTGYFYACDNSRKEGDDLRILDAMLIYNVKALQDKEAQRLASIQWSHNGLQAVLYLNGIAQALVDYAERCGYCRQNFPNFASQQGERWRQSSHAWNDEALKAFESNLYAEPAN